MQIAILGRQPELGTAELERIYGSDSVTWFSSETVTVKTDFLDVNRLGGSQKAGEVIVETSGDWRSVSQKLVRFYADKWHSYPGKITLGISAYGFKISPREVQKTGLVLKSKLKQAGVSLRLVPNETPALSSATSHHNKLGLSDNKVELLIVRGNAGKIIIAESRGAQNITALSRRDQGRPKRDAFVGMLPPKLAMMMVNMAVGNLQPTPAVGDTRRGSAQNYFASKQKILGADRVAGPASPPTLLDPFCGTGVLLQEAALLGLNVYGTDLSDKMIDYTHTNLDWLKSSHRIDFDAKLYAGDAVETKWQPPIDFIATEAYLGQPFSAPPNPKKLAEVRQTCNTIISKFLINISNQIKSGTPICLAVPAWRDTSGNFTHLPLTRDIKKLGYNRVEFKNISHNQLLYRREDQIVARELLIIKKL